MNHSGSSDRLLQYFDGLLFNYFFKLCNFHDCLEQPLRGMVLPVNA